MSMQRLIHGSFIRNNQKLETTLLPFNKWMDTQTVVLYPYKRIPLNNEKEQTTGTHYNMDESQKHCAEWKKPTQNSEKSLNDNTQSRIGWKKWDICITACRT